MAKRLVILGIFFIYSWFFWLPLFNNSNRYGARCQAYGFAKILDDSPAISKTRGDTYYFSDGVSVTITFFTRFAFGLLSAVIGFVGVVPIMLISSVLLNRKSGSSQ